MEIGHKLQQSTGIGTGICGSTCTGTGTGAGAQGMNYCLKMDGFVRSQDKIYVPDSSELKKVILRKFHVKPYSGHPGYQKTLTMMKIFYYWLNIKRDVVVFLANCFGCQHVKAKCKHPGGMVHLITNPEWK